MNSVDCFLGVCRDQGMGDIDAKVLEATCAMIEAVVEVNVLDA